MPAQDAEHDKPIGLSTSNKPKSEQNEKRQGKQMDGETAEKLQHKQIDKQNSVQAQAAKDHDGDDAWKRWRAWEYWQDMLNGWQGSPM